MKERYEWLAANWKAGLAFIYSLVVVFDFIVVPSWIGLHRPDLFQVLQALKGLSPEIQQVTLQIAFRSHEAFTLQGSGLFHLAFGALLTGAAVTKDPLLLTREQNKQAKGIPTAVIAANVDAAVDTLTDKPKKKKPVDDDDPSPPAV